MRYCVNPAQFRKAVVKNDLDHLCDQLGMLGLLAECAASGCRGLGGLRLAQPPRNLRSYGPLPRCGRRDTDPVASRYDQERRPKIRVIVIFILITFWVGGLKRHLLIEASVEMGAISFVRMTIMRHLPAPADK